MKARGVGADKTAASATLGAMQAFATSIRTIHVWRTMR
jgi:hypothetical protein